MDDHEEEDDLSFGALRAGQTHAPADLLDKVLGESDTVVGGASPQDIVARGRGVAEIKPMAVNQATMCCIRGPCVHLWALTYRASAQIRGWDRIQITRDRQCNAHYEPTDLTESNIFECGLWWPAPLSFVPVSLRATLRPYIHRLWNRWLKSRGYDFSWKWWEDSIFEKDTREERGQAMPPSRPAELLFNDPVGGK